METTKDNHSIESFRFCIDTPDDISAHEMQNTVSQLFKTNIHPKISALLTECAGDEFITLDSIEVDLGEINSDSLHLLPNLVLDALRKQLIIALEKLPHSSKQTNAPDSLRIASYLLQHGASPWWAPQTSTRPLRHWIETAVKEAPQAFLTFLSENLQQASVRSRFSTNTTPTVSDELLSCTQNQLDTPNRIELIELFNPAHFQLSHFQKIRQFLQAPPSSPFPEQLNALIKQAEKETSSQKVRDSIYSALNSSVLRQQLIKQLPTASLSDLIKYISPEETSLPQIQVMHMLVAHHFAKNPQQAVKARQRLWDLAIIHTVEKSPLSTHLLASFQSLRQEGILNESDFPETARIFLQKPNQQLPPLVEQQIRSFIDTPHLRSTAETVRGKISTGGGSNAQHHPSKSLADQVLAFVTKLTTSAIHTDSFNPAALKKSIQHALLPKSLKGRTLSDYEQLAEIYLRAADDQHITYDQLVQGLQPFILEHAKPLLIEIHQQLLSTPTSASVRLSHPTIAQLFTQFEEGHLEPTKLIVALHKEPQEQQRQILIDSHHLSIILSTPLAQQLQFLSILHPKQTSEHQELLQNLVPLHQLSFAPPYSGEQIYRAILTILLKEKSPPKQLHKILQQARSELHIPDEIWEDSILPAISEVKVPLPSTLRQVKQTLESFSTPDEINRVDQLPVLLTKANLHPSIAQLFIQFEDSHLEPTKLIVALHKEPQDQQRQILIDSHHLSIILSSPLAQQLQFLSILHPKQESEHQELLQQLVPLHQLSLAPPYSGEQIYRAILTILLKEKSPPKLLHKILQQARLELQIPDEIWKDSILPAISEVTVPLRQIKQTLESFSTPDEIHRVDQLPGLLAKATKEIDRAQLRSFMFNNLNPNQLEPLISSLPQKSLDQIVDSLNQSTANKFSTLINEVLLIIPKIKELSISSKLQQYELYHWTLTFLAKKIPQANNKLWLEGAISHLATFSSQNAAQFEQQFNQLIKYISPEETSLPQIQVMHMLVAHHFAKNPQQAVKARQRLWDLAIIHTVEKSPLSTHLLASFQSLRQEGILNESDFPETARIFLQKPNQQLPPLVEQQIRSFIDTPHLRSTAETVRGKISTGGGSNAQHHPSKSLADQVLAFVTKLTTSAIHTDSFNPAALKKSIQHALLPKSLKGRTLSDYEQLAEIYLRAADDQHITYDQLVQGLQPFILEHAKPLLIEIHQQLLSTPTSASVRLSHPTIAQLFTQFEEGHLEPTKLIVALHKEPQEQQRQILIDSHHLSIILSTPLAQQLQFLSILHPKQTSEHQELLQNLVPLHQLSFAPPYSGEQIYRAILTILLKEKSPPKQLHKILQQARSELHIPDEIWEDSILPAISEVKVPLPSTLRQVKQTLESFSTPDEINRVDQLPVLLTKANLHPSIAQLFIQFEDSHLEPTKLIVALHKEPQDQQRQILIDSHHLSIILSSPLAQQLQFLSILHPKQESEHQELLQQLVPLHQLSLAPPYSGEQIYRAILTILLKEKSPPKLLHKILQQARLELQIPDEIWKDSILPAISEVTVPLRQIKQTLESFSTPDEIHRVDQLPGLLAKATKEIDRAQLRSFMFNNLNPNQLEPLISSLPQKSLDQIVDSLNQSTANKFSTLINEVLLIIPKIKELSISSKLQQYELYHWTLTFLAKKIPQANNKLWLEGAISHLATFSSQNAAQFEQQFNQLINKLAHPELSKHSPVTPVAADQEPLERAADDSSIILQNPDHQVPPAGGDDPLATHSMPELWAKMLESLWDSDPMAVIQQLAEVALCGTHAITHHQAISQKFLKNIFQSLQPDLSNSITSLQQELHTLCDHQLIPGITNSRELDRVLNPILILLLGSTHPTSQTNASLTKALLYSLAQNQGISFYLYLAQLQKNLRNAPIDWLQQSTLPSVIQALSIASNIVSSTTPLIQLPKGSLLTSEDLVEIDPLLFHNLESFIAQEIQASEVTPEDSSSLQKTILQQCLQQLPALWPHHSSPAQLLSSALQSLNIKSTQRTHLNNLEEVDEFTYPLTHIHALFCPNSALPDDSILITSLKLIYKAAPERILIPLSQKIKQATFLKRLESRTLKLQILILQLLAPQEKTLLHCLISRIKETPTKPSEKILWSRALKSMSHLYPHRLQEQEIVSHFLSADTTPMQEQAEKLLHIHQTRRYAGYARLNITLYRLSKIHGTEDNSPPPLLDSQTTRIQINERLKEEACTFTTTELKQLSELHSNNTTLSTIIDDLLDTLTVIATHNQQEPTLKPLIEPLLDDTLTPQTLVSQFILATASEYDTSLPSLLKNHWSMIQDLSSSYQDPCTFSILYQAISSLLPEQEIPLPKLPGSNQTIFETISISDSKKKVEITQASTDDKPPMVTEIDNEVWLIENAGLVIFAPYIEMLFDRANLLEDRSFPSSDQAIQAIFLLQHIITGENKAEEYQLLLNRVLCNYPLDQPLPLSVEPAEDWPELTRGLIGAVIQHWNTIGDTSPKSLIQTFIKRQGSLRFDNEEGWSLHIPEGPYDLLLTSLPWAISTINLPWMDHPLRVEWK